MCLHTKKKDKTWISLLSYRKGIYLLNTIRCINFTLCEFTLMRLIHLPVVDVYFFVAWTSFPPLGLVFSIPVCHYPPPRIISLEKCLRTKILHLNFVILSCIVNKPNSILSLRTFIHSHPPWNNTFAIVFHTPDDTGKGCHFERIKWKF